MRTIEQKIKSVEAWPRHAGKSDYLRFLKGERLTQREAIKAHCYNCCCGEPGLCCSEDCSLRPYQLLIQHKSSESACTSTNSELLGLG